MKHPRGLYKAIKYFGSQENFARVLGVSRSSIGHWLNGVRNLPDFLALKIFYLTKGTISLDELGHDHKNIYKIAESVVTYTKTPAIQILTKEIKLGRMHCPIYKNQTTLLSDANDIDIYAPILIDENNYLISCECRLLANLELKRQHIYAYRLNLIGIINGHECIPALVETLPISERVALGLALEKEAGSRQGKRNDLSPQKMVMASKNHLQLVENSAQVKWKKKTRETIANLSGFSNYTAYRQAKEVVGKGVPKLIQAMDQQIFTLNKANSIVKLPPADQHHALNNVETLRPKDKPTWRS